MSAIPLLIALTGEALAGAYLPFSPQETPNTDFIASWGDGDASTVSESAVAKDDHVSLALEQNGLLARAADKFLSIWTEGEHEIHGVYYKPLEVE